MSEWVLGKFRKVYIRCSNRSWIVSANLGGFHRATVFVSFLTAKETKTMGDIGQDSGYVCSPMDSSLETSDMCTFVVDGRLVLQNYLERPTSELSPTQTTTSPEHKKASKSCLARNRTRKDSYIPVRYK